MMSKTKASGICICIFQIIPLCVEVCYITKNSSMKHFTKYSITTFIMPALQNLIFDFGQYATYHGMYITLFMFCKILRKRAKANL